MNLAWKEIKKNKLRFLSLGSIIFLISLLTFMICGLANGLSQDNASLIKDLPTGQFYMNQDAEETYNLSRIDRNIQEKWLNDQNDAVALSIQMGFLNDKHDKQQSVAFVTSTVSNLFNDVKAGEVILDDSLKDKGIKVGDILTNNQYNGEFFVKGFMEQKKFSHAPVAFINMEDYKEMYRVDEMQLIFVPGQDTAILEDGLQSFSNKQLLETIPSYNAQGRKINSPIYTLANLFSRTPINHFGI